MSEEEGRKTLSTEESDRLNAALAMSCLATGLSPVKIIEETSPTLSPASRTSHHTASHPASTSCSESPRSAITMEETGFKLHTTKMNSLKNSQQEATQTEPLDLSSPSVPSKFFKLSKLNRERHDSGNESNASPEPEDRTLNERTIIIAPMDNDTIINNTNNIINNAKSNISNSFGKSTTIKPPHNIIQIKGISRPDNKGISRPDNLGLKSTVHTINPHIRSTTNSTIINATNSTHHAYINPSIGKPIGTAISPVKSESELDSPAQHAKSFAHWTAPYNPTHLRLLSSDCQSYSSSTSGYSSESFSEARSESEIESPGPERLRSHLPPKKRKHIRHAKNWDIETKKKSTPTPGSSTTNGDDDVFISPTESPAKTDVGHAGQRQPTRVMMRPNSKTQAEKIRINPKLIQEIHLAVTPDEEGDLPLHIAVVQENKDVIARVIPLMKVAGLSIDTPNSLRQTPLHLAVITGEAEIVSYLVRQGAAPDFSDRDGNTSLHLAVRHKQLECLKVILLQDPSKFNVNCKNFEGMTPLHVAVQEKGLEITQCLLDHGADIDCQDGKSGRTALHHAVEATCPALVAELLKRNANVNQPSYSGCSPLHVASGRGHLDIVQLLVQYGADTTMRNFSVSVDNYQAATQNTQGASGSSKSPSGGGKRNQKASVKRKLREKINT